jgi:polyhydroxyalkanoic acid synthase PhaR subunit
MNGNSEESKPFDPIEAWREIRDAGMESWSKAMIEAVNSEEYAKTTGAMLNAYLAAAGPVREAVESIMVATLQQMQMPTRSDFVSLAERLTNIEMRLDDIDAKLDAQLRRRHPAPQERDKAEEPGKKEGKR